MRDTGWFKSSFSGGATDNCVEVNIADHSVSVRDSKSPAAGALHVAPATWAHFVNSVR